VTPSSVFQTLFVGLTSATVVFAPIAHSSPQNLLTCHLIYHQARHACSAEMGSIHNEHLVFLPHKFLKAGAVRTSPALLKKSVRIDQEADKGVGQFESSIYVNR
jgi:hypothetical protein